MVTVFSLQVDDWASVDEQRWRQRLHGWLNLVASLDGEHVGMASGKVGDPCNRHRCGWRRPPAATASVTPWWTAWSRGPHHVRSC
ncbi:hypothetical protein AB0H12_05035 [Actinosynnema sp. NPDC023794]